MLRASNRLVCENAQRLMISALGVIDADTNHLLQGNSESIRQTGKHTRILSVLALGSHRSRQWLGCFDIDGEGRARRSHPQTE